MKKGRRRVAFVLALFLVLAVGIVLANVIRNGCDCFGQCYYCKPEVGCTEYGGAGGCFCTDNPCSLGRWLCCKKN
jgi:hypothetical protein